MVSGPRRGYALRFTSVQAAEGVSWSYRESVENPQDSSADYRNYTAAVKRAGGVTKENSGMAGVGGAGGSKAFGDVRS